jgi:Ca2+-transporting ATPase
LVQAFKANGEIVSMTGDGVNDAPALKAAHVGVAMGRRGTDVAREAAAIVLLKDDFGSLVDTIRRGRGIYDNLSHAMAYLVAVHIPIAGLGLLPVLFGWPLLLLPLHILFLEFVIDPACSFVFEADQPPRNIMHRQPRPPSSPLFSAPLVRRSMWLGSMSMALVVGIYAAALRRLPAEQARSIAFAALVIANLALILVSRTPEGTVLGAVRRPNRIFWSIAGATVLLLFASIHVEAIAQTFKFAAPPSLALLATVVTVAAVVLLLGRVLQPHSPQRERASQNCSHPTT